MLLSLEKKEENGRTGEVRTRDLHTPRVARYLAKGTVFCGGSLIQPRDRIIRFDLLPLPNDFAFHVSENAGATARGGLPI